jgi:hypothetical protein
MRNALRDYADESGKVITVGARLEIIWEKYEHPQ